ncbi:triacylglycerol lipase V precursor [Venturia nashicola]|nr:triacylglycerol lipase V precursor [Venturia nashicola]
MIPSYGFLLLASSVAYAAQLQRLSARQDAPIAKSVNSTYSGKYVSAYNQDVFLGTPFAQPPLGDLRFRRPISLNTSREGPRDAKEFGYSCFQNYNRTDMSEDCLTLNVFRPAGINYKTGGLPVIYAGGFYAGSSAEKAYDPNNIISLSEELSKPIIAVALNYRLDVWGYLSTPEILAEKEANAGLMDQRMALRWIKENIVGFDGDPNRVTVWGLPAGAQSIGSYLHLFARRDDMLFHAAVIESGEHIGAALQALPVYSEPFENLAKANGCQAAANYNVSDQSPPSHSQLTSPHNFGTQQ